ncbi:MAG: methyl-accepting chemotaxis protein [Beijerinckiaceae bacterium]
MPTLLSSTLKNIPVIIRIHAITLVALIGVISLALLLAVQLRDKLGIEAESRTQHLVETAEGIVKHYYDEAQAGHLTKEQAQAAAFAALRAMRYDNGNYFFVTSFEGTTLMHGANAALEHNKVAQATTLSKVTAEILETANKQGAGFVHYDVAKPGETEPKPKLSYIASFKPWEWIVGTGIFIDNIDAKVNSAFLQTAGIGLSIALLVALVAYLLARGIVGPLNRVVAAQERLIADDLHFDMPDADRADEIGRIARGVVAAKDSAIQRKTLESEAEARRKSDQEELQRKAELDRKYIAEFEQFMTAFTKALEQLSEGDLTYRLNTAFAAEYEKIRGDFNTSVEKLQQTMLHVSANTSAIRAGTGEITSAADDLSRRTEQQAASLEETAAALDEITATVRKTAQGATHAREVVSTAKSDAERGGTVVRQAIEAMNGIEKSSQQIGQIIGVIDEIAFQTNLLALNAGVEAARAGDAGRGFAVVASEVRALAQRSAEAAKEIKALIMASRGQVDQGVDLVAETGKALDRIFTQVAEIDKVVTDIAASAQEEATGLQEVNSAVNQMDQVTQQNASMVEESTAASHTLAKETEELTRLIGRFRVGRTEAVAQGDPPRRAPAKPAAAARPVLKTVASRGGAAPKPAADEWEEI